MDIVLYINLFTLIVVLFNYILQKSYFKKTIAYIDKDIKAITSFIRSIDGNISIKTIGNGLEDWITDCPKCNMYLPKSDRESHKCR